MMETAQKASLLTMSPTNVTLALKIARTVSTLLNVLSVASDSTWITKSVRISVPLENTPKSNPMILLFARDVTLNVKNVQDQNPTNVLVALLQTSLLTKETVPVSVETVIIQTKLPENAKPVLTSVLLVPLLMTVLPVMTTTSYRTMNVNHSVTATTSKD